MTVRYHSWRIRLSLKSHRSPTGCRPPQLRCTEIRPLRRASPTFSTPPSPHLRSAVPSSRSTAALLSLFWHNIVGRFTKISAPAALDYTTGHKSWPGKCLVELPVYLLPWTLLCAAAVGRAWVRLRSGIDRGTPWRFAICAIVPFLVLLSLAATARDIYAAPI